MYCNNDWWIDKSVILDLFMDIFIFEISFKEILLDDE